MFTNIWAKNFKSLKEIELNLNKTKSQTNKLIVIYGENGVGKTHIVQLFEFLKKSLFSRVSQYELTDMINKENDEEAIYRINSLKKALFSISNYRMIGENDPTEIKYSFKIDNKEGYYYIKFDDDEILEEILFYVADKQRDILFDIKKSDKKIISNLNKIVFKDEKYNNELIDNVEKYWGKSSFISILLKEFAEKNEEYVDARISENVSKFMELVIEMNSSARRDTFKIEYLFTRNERISDLVQGVISSKNKEILEKYEKIIKLIFTQIYLDVRNVYYEYELINDEMRYKLFFDKMIGNKKRKIPVSLESTGTKLILKNLSSLLNTLNGKVSVIDEIDNGIHNLLIKKILTSALPDITGQLIITTHNTQLMESLPIEYIYILSKDSNGNKEISSIRDLKYKIQKSNNVRDLYLKGSLGGVLKNDEIDFEKIKVLIKEEDED